MNKNEKIIAGIDTGGIIVAVITVTLLIISINDGTLLTRLVALLSISLVGVYGIVAILKYKNCHRLLPAAVPSVVICVLWAGTAIVSWLAIIK